MGDQTDRTDPTEQYDQPEQTDEQQPHSGLTQTMQDRPHHGEDPYRGSSRLTGKRAVITGADSGIGRAVALAFAREGADVVLSYLAAEEWPSQRGRARFLDVCRSDERCNVGGRTERPAPQNVIPPPARRGLLGLPIFALLFLTGCSPELVAQIKRFGFPPAGSDRSKSILDLWIGSWIAAFAVGFIVWGLILWSSNRYKTKHAKMPRQNRYNLPMEVFYTVAPFIIIAVLFYYTVLAQNAVQRKVADPEVTIDVVGQKWSWTFNYKAANNPAVGSDVWEAGTINKTPDLYLPVGKLIQFNLSSPDVVHSFWVPSFYEKLDVIPGRLNTLQLTAPTEGVFAGKCAEFCGTYHSAMLFNVHVVSEADYNAYLKSLAAKGQTGEAKGPALANSPVRTGSEEGTR